MGEDQLCICPSSIGPPVHSRPHAFAPLLRKEDRDDAPTPAGGRDEEDGGGARDRWPEWTGQNPQEGERMREWAGLGSGGVCEDTPCGAALPQSQLLNNHAILQRAKKRGKNANEWKVCQSEALLPSSAAAELERWIKSVWWGLVGTHVTLRRCWCV